MRSLDPIHISATHAECIIYSRIRSPSSPAHDVLGLEFCELREKLVSSMQEVYAAHSGVPNACSFSYNIVAQFSKQTAGTRPILRPFQSFETWRVDVGTGNGLGPPPVERETPQTSI